jgi:RNA polymerase sigma factor (TIGR02999 family)
MNSPAVTQWLETWRQGDPGALSLIVPEMYTELRRAAAGCLRREWSSRTLQSTALVHEFYAAIAGSKPLHCHNRTHFLGIARRLMRQILIQYARHRRAAKRDGGEVQSGLNEAAAFEPPRPAPEEALSDALSRLRRYRPRTHLIVEMHYRFGSTVQEIAETVHLSVRTVERELRVGRGWLELELKGARDPRDASKH